MQQALFNNIMIIVLITVGVFCRGNLLPMILAAGICMVLVTWSSFEDEDKWWLTGAKLAAMAVFAVSTGTVWGFAVFMLSDELRAFYRGVLAVVLFAVSGIFLYGTDSYANLILSELVLVVTLAVVFGIKYLIDYVRGRRENDRQKIVEANLGELRAKRLNEQLVAKNYLADKNARMYERENISRNIHNSVGHTITAAIMTLDAADMLYEVRPEDARKKMNDANERIRGSLESIRRAVRVLDEDNRTISVGDLKCEMESILDNFMMDTSIRIQSSFDEADDGINLPREHVEFLTGVLSELLSNGVRHGGADYFMVLLSGDGGHIRLVVSDNGTGDFSEENRAVKISQGFGLKKIISYVERCGGRAEFENGEGFRSLVELPVYGGEND